MENSHVTVLCELSCGSIASGLSRFDSAANGHDLDLFLKTSPRILLLGESWPRCQLAQVIACPILCKVYSPTHTPDSEASGLSLLMQDFNSFRSRSQVL